jgi:two-component system phosphate regulon sensor histidine kinase PhoR
MDVLVAVLSIAFVVVLGWALVLRRRLAERSLAVASEPPTSPDLLRPIFDAATAAIDLGLIVIDAERTIQHLNSQAIQLLSPTTTPAPGQGLIMLVRDYQVDTLVAEVIEDGEPRELVLQPAAQGRILRLRATRFSGPDLEGAVLLIRDVTQLNMLERARRDLVANISHELRTPLASVKLLVETLQSEPPPSIAQRMLSQMGQEVDAVTQLVDELHQLSQIESGRVTLQLEPANLATLVLRTVERMQPQTERKSLQIQTSVDDQLPLVLMDASRIGQVLLNLLHNAAKFTAEHGTIEIHSMVISVAGATTATGYIERRLRDALPTIHPDRRRSSVALAQQGRPAIDIPVGHAPGDWVLVRVTDTGIGIPSQDLPRIFERFYKVDRARTRNSSGTGLGLAIAKHLVEGHGGRIWVLSREGRGSTFCFTLPVA